MATDWLCSLVPDHGDIDDDDGDDDDDDRDNDDDNDVDDDDGDDDHGESYFFIRKHVEMSSGPYTGAKIIVWAISWREGDDVGPEAQRCTIPAIHQRCPQRQTRFSVSHSPELQWQHSCVQRFPIVADIFHLGSTL